jgi:hypothetical protein
MVEEPTKTFRGALAFFRGASCSIKTRDPIKQDRMIDFATGRRIVNAANKNKRVLVERRCFGRMKSLRAGRARKNVLAHDCRHSARNDGCGPIAGDPLFT